MPRSIFLSWAGEESRVIARALRSWLPCLSGDLHPWMSSDIPPGRPWREELSSRLEATNTGILCVTTANRDSPWLYFEAGALSRSVQAQVIPYVAGISPPPLPEPISQFQAVRATRDGTAWLVRTLLAATSGAFDPRMFAAFWPVLDRAIAAAPGGESAAQPAVDEIEALYDARQSLELREVRLSQDRVTRGDALQIQYVVETTAHGLPCWLGASIWSGGDLPIFNQAEDTAVSLRRGTQQYARRSTVPANAPPGEYRLNAEVWYGPRGHSESSYPLRGQWPTQHTLTVRP
jgi:hypothetical protein